MIFKNAIILLIGLAALVSCEKFRFDNYHLVRLFPKTTEHIQLLNKLEHSPDFDVWTSETGEELSSDVLLSPTAFLKYKLLFSQENIRMQILDRDIQKKFDAQERSMVREKNSRSIIFKYARYSEMMTFLDQKVTENPAITSVYVAGTTYEGNDLKVIVINTKVNPNPKSIWIDCGIHAREWVSPASCINLIEKLLEEYKNNDPVTVSILNKFEIHVMPIVNADGYEYSYNTYRLWRKNRTPNSIARCPGTDLNRNFNYQWLTNNGASSDPCSDLYAGKSAESELETKAVTSAINSKLGNWAAYINIHSYGHYWLLPWGYTSVRPSDYAEMESAALAGVNAIKAVNGSNYTYGPSSTQLYINSGSGKDWAKGVANIKYSYVIELSPGPGTSDYSYGFTLPEDRMPRVATELYAGVKAFLNGI